MVLNIDMSTENYMVKSMEEQLNLQDELKEHAEITVRGIVKMLPPDVQTILYNAERLEGKKSGTNGVWNTLENYWKKGK